MNNNYKNYYGKSALFCLNSQQDDKIRKALQHAHKMGKLAVVACVTGIAGGTKRLQKIMNSTGELDIIDRGILGMYLDIK